MLRSQKERSIDEILFDNQSVIETSLNPNQQVKPWEPEGFTIEQIRYRRLEIRFKNYKFRKLNTNFDKIRYVNRINPKRDFNFKIINGLKK
jgi:hypothetical protein